ncbi:DUF554 domain-containing protein [Salipaludibacillus sp. LMS25]|jgi:uncharacterized membrane protein YqgA involved in biofilm formation|uniref:DUF554 domain-containing protein n=1 Tax=Salipaludibacillus sp. LMS25 TaxID=2924031 RepID=UPI0020D1808B|nr:DUF554 domain-containing protein [Salipaludibacillus sp. LMS25]
MAIIGALNSGMRQDHSVLLNKISTGWLLRDCFCGYDGYRNVMILTVSVIVYQGGIA